MPNFGDELVLWRLPSSAGRKGVTIDQLSEALAADPDFISEIEAGLNLPVNVKTEGATGDGVTDDTAAIQSAIDSVPSTGGTVVFPEGEYLLTATLTSSNKPICLSGEGISISILKWDAASASTGILINQNNQQFWTCVTNLSIQTEQAGLGDALFINYPNVGQRGVQSIKTANLLFEGASGPATDGWLNGITINNAHQSDHKNIAFVGHYSGTLPNIISADAFEVSGLGNPSHHVIDHFRVQHASRAVAVLGSAEKVFVSNCVFDPCNKGIEFNTLATQPELALNASSINSYDAGIEATNMTQSYIYDCRISARSDATNNQTGIDFINNVENCIIHDCVFFNFSAFAFNAIEITGSSNHNIIHHNTFENVSTAVTLNAGVTQNQIVDNLVNTATVAVITDNSANTTNFTAQYDKVNGRYEYLTGDLSVQTALNIPSVSTLTIDVLEEVTVTASHHLIDTLGGAPTDDLVNILGGNDGDLLILQSASNARLPTLKDATGNMRLNGDMELRTVEDRILLQYDSSVALPPVWVEIGRGRFDNLNVRQALTFEQDPSNGIVGGTITVSQTYTRIDTEGLAATDDLDQINIATNMGSGSLLILRSTAAARVITVRDNIGNLFLAANFVMTTSVDTLTLIRQGGSWYEISRSDNQ